MKINKNISFNTLIQYCLKKSILSNSWFLSFIVNESGKFLLSSGFGWVGPDLDVHGWHLVFFQPRTVFIWLLVIMLCLPKICISQSVAWSVTMNQRITLDLSVERGWYVHSLRSRNRLMYAWNMYFWGMTKKSDKDRAKLH